MAKTTTNTVVPCVGVSDMGLSKPLVIRVFLLLSSIPMKGQCHILIFFFIEQLSVIHSEIRTDVNWHA